MSAPGFWDDQGRAAAVSAEQARVSRKLEGYRTLMREYDDARELASMDGGELDSEIAAGLVPLRAELERLQEAALFDGEYDAGDAVVTLQSGTGGTDAQDWAEIMLRMYERWAANRGFPVELLEASPGEEAGLKSATFTVQRRERVRDPEGGARQAPARPVEPVRPGASPAHGVLDGDRRAAASARCERRDRRRRLED